MARLVAPEHPIKSVTIFKSRKAEVVRVFQLDFKKGQNKLEITQLPSVIDSHSVRVSGLKPTCRLFDVVCRVGKASGYDDGTLRQLKAQRDQLIKERETREKGSQILFQYAQTITGEHVRPEQMSQFVENLVEQNKKSQSAITSLNEQIFNLNLKISKIEEGNASQMGTAHGKIDIVIVADDDCSSELKLTYIVSNVDWYPTYELHAKTESGKPSPSVSLHYRARITQSTGESWNNTSLTLSTVSSDNVVDGSIPQLKALRIQPAPLFGSAVRQSQRNNNTGFPQFAGKAQPFGAFGASNLPVVNSRDVSFGAPSAQPALNQQTQTSAFGSSTGLFGSSANTTTSGGSLFGGGGAPSSGGLFGSSANTATFGGGPFGGGVVPQAVIGGHTSLPPVPESTHPLPDEDFEEVEDPAATITEPKTIVSETPIAIAYSVHGESTIPSDGIQHQVSIAVLPFQSKISYITIPRITPRVFLQCLVVNSSEYRLLAGPVSVIMDESYVSKTSIPDISTGDTFECTLGDDASTKVTYSRTPRLLASTGGSFAEVTNTTSYTTTITVHNKHNFPITDLIVRDVIPTSEDKRVKIVLRKPNGLANAKDGQVIDVEGTDGLKVGWEKTVDGKGGEKEGRYEWKWKVESGAKVTFLSEWEVKTPGDCTWTEVFNPELRFGHKA
ncbi:hypothetical protein CVT24_007939 [Panaeolus cyanescens]|uniref:DUF4139 domain-containing protein n=1 Tax=Panaeolus cyanescens TaxID=181874 RepID=A0A409WCX2_9AGAR|nr:hypothetical protein CVT24_007939 [Panaeolus cyanescens]